jgi:predicted acylesterase/phospholipase RssA
MAYVGAYKALIDLFPDTYIRSLIGSSAGGMISLAVSAGLSVDEIIGVVMSLVETANDRVIQKVEDITV